MNTITRTASLAALLTLATTLGACVSSEEQRYANLSEDSGTCGDFGARRGTPAYTDCMLQQQNRRDNEQLIAMEKQRISAETARNNLEMVRRMRADRARN